MKKKYFKLLLSGVIFPALLLSCRGGELRPDTVIATVNGQPILEYRYQELLKEELKNGKDDTRKLRAIVGNRVITQEIFAQQALKNGLDKQEEVKQRILAVNKAILAKALISNFLKNNPTLINDEAINESYRKLSAEISVKNEYHLRKIVTNNEEDANKALATLAKKVDFVAAVMQHSEDFSVILEKGGDMGWITQDKLTEPIANAISKLKPGEYTKPAVKFNDRFYITKIEEMRKAISPPLSSVKQEVVLMLQKQESDKYIDGLVKQSKITINRGIKDQSNEAIAVVNDQPIPTFFYQELLKIETNEGKVDTPELRKNIREELIRLEVSEQQALKDGLDKQEEVKQKISLTERNVLAKYFVENFNKKNPISDEMVDNLYNDRINADGPTTEYHLHQIITADKKNANKVLAALERGDDFAAVARQYSIDNKTKNNGGDTGWLVPSPEKFANAISKLKPGEYTRTAINIYDVFYIIKVEDIRNNKRTSNAFSVDIKKLLKHKMQEEQFQKYMNSIYNEYKIEINVRK